MHVCLVLLLLHAAFPGPVLHRGPDLRALLRQGTQESQNTGKIIHAKSKQKGYREEICYTVVQKLKFIAVS